MWSIHHSTLQNLIEERHADYLCSFTPDSISQIDRDASIALATIREWRNSFAPINRIPMDILSLIPTHFPTQKGRFRAASVCRHWRGVLLRNGTLWSQLFLGKGEECISTLLERAKGSALDVITGRNAPVGAVSLISPRAQQIVSLEFMENRWQDVMAFSELNSGQLPLLHTLKITSLETFDPHDAENDVIPPSFRFFRGSTDLGQFNFRSSRLSSLNHFVFPNLTTFRLLPFPTKVFSALCLLNFLKASPLLQILEMDIIAKIDLMSVPQDMVVVLPSVETFFLHVLDDTVPQVYDFASHISCPRVKYVSLTHATYDDDMNASMEVFPTPVVWNTIVRQYTASPIAEVELNIEHSEGKETICFLTFRSFDAIVVRLGLTVRKAGAEDELNMSHAEMGCGIYSQALKTIRNHPLLSHVKRLHIEQNSVMSDPYEMLWVTNEFQKLFGSMGPLDKWTIRGCDLDLFLVKFLDTPEFNFVGPPTAFPHTKEFKILYPSMGVNEVRCTKAIVDLAKSQHALGIPFERVMVRTWILRAGVAEELRRWVAAVCCGEWSTGEEE